MASALPTRPLAFTRLAAALLCAVLLIGLWTLVVRQVASEASQAIHAAERTNDNLASAHAAHVALSLKKFDQLLRVVRDLDEREGRRFDLDRSLAAFGADRRYLISAGIVDARGEHLHRTTSPWAPNVSDREYFIWHATRADDALFVGRPIQGRVSKAWGVTLSLRRTSAGGEFDGVIYALLDPAFFTELYERSDVGANGAMALIGTDGITRARRNAGKVSFGEDVSSSRLFKEWPSRRTGSYIGVAASDGQRRIASYRQLDDYPLIVLVASGYDEALQPASDRSRWYYAAAVLGTAMLLTLVGLAWLRQSEDERTLRLVTSREAQYRLLYEQNLNGVLLARPDDGRLIAANPAALAILGLTEGDLGDKRLHDVLVLGDLDLTRMRRVSADGRPEHHPLKARRSDGQQVDVDVAAREVQNERGEPVLYLVFNDITEQTRLQQEQQRLREEAEAASRAREVAEQANHAKSEFMSRVSHELRTPLNAVLGFSQLLSMDEGNGLTTSHRAQVGQIERAGRHLLALIDDLLDISRLESGALRVKLEPTDAVALTRQVLEEAQMVAGARGIALQLDSLGRARCLVQADRTRLRQIITNLVSNGVKYGRKGGQVTVQLRHTGGTVRIGVIDNGIGIRKDQLAKLFTPFERLGREGQGIDGTGIGLVISKRLTELMGGTLEVLSADGVGSTFTLELPAATDDAPGALPIEAPGLLRPAKLLYIDDEESNLAVMRGLISLQPQLALSTAVESRDGLNKALAERPDAMLIDIRLPGISGIELVKAIRSDDRLQHVPCVAVSAHTMPEEIARALAAGFDGYITKPVEAAQVFAELRRVLGR